MEVPVSKIQISQSSYDFIEMYHKKFKNTYGSHWGTIVEDQAALVDLINSYSLESFCEIGTWEGYTSLAMWMQPSIKRGRAIDVCTNFEGGGDNYHKDLEKYGRYFKDITPVELIVSDSVSYTPESTEKYDLVFIDGNHSYDYVKRDLSLAIKMSTRIIAFHDYNNQNPGVDKFLSELSKKVEIFNYDKSAVVYIKAAEAREKWNF